MPATIAMNRAGVPGSGTAISASGCKQATFDVDGSGQATYRIAIEVPPGIAALQPQLALCYSHRLSNGILGVGWSLAGLSAITRIKATYAVDGFNGGIGYDANDRYALDGQRLINIQGGYGQPGTVYYTEMQSWRYIQAGNTDEDGFTVTMKNGQVANYGATTDSRILACGGQAVRVWALSSLEDGNGNRIEFGYTPTPVDGSQDTGAYYLDKISYTVRDDQEANRFIQCTYEDRPDPISTYIGGYPVLTGYRMNQIITSLSGDNVIRTYTLNYRVSTATQLSCIESITESGAASAGSPSLPSTQIVWQDIVNPGFDINPSSQLDQHSKPLGVQPMDVNGDGRTDLVQLWQDTDNTIHATTYLATPVDGGTSYVRTSDSNLGAFPDTRQVLPMDVTGDGRNDLVIAYKSGTGNELKLAIFLSDGQGFSDGGVFDTGETWDTANHIAFYATDVNGDGRTDLVEAYKHYDPTYGSLLYFRSWLSLFGDGGGQLFTPTIVSPTQDPADPTTQLALWPLDVNGDGMTDMVRVWQRGSDAHIIVSAYLSVSTAIDNVSFSQKVDSDLGTFSLADQIGFFPADVNGDGMTDLLQIWQEPGTGSTTLHLTSFLCNGAGGFVAGPDSTFENQHLDQNSFYPMGFNGGGQTDILNKWVSGNNELMFTVYSSSPSGTFRLATDFNTGVAGTTIANASFFPGDANGDGKADLIRVSASQDNQPVIVPYTSSGEYPDLADRITNPLGGMTTIQYAPISDSAVYTAATSPGFPKGAGLRYPNPLTPAQFPIQSVIGQALYVVSAYVQSNDSSLNRYVYSASYEMSYANAQVDLLGRGWEGFETVSRLSLDNGFRIVQVYNQDYPMTGTSASTRIEADGAYATDPRVPKDDTAVLMSMTNYTYQTFVRASGATDPDQQVLEVLKTGSQSDQYDYGEDHFDYAIGMSFDYDDYGNQDKYVYQGYVDPSTGDPLYPDEVVYRYSLYQNDILQHGWALGYLLYAKVTANATDPDITRFLPGDFQLQQSTYAASTYNLVSQGKWDNSNNCYLTTAYTYDAYGNRKTESQPGGLVTTNTYETDYNTFLMKTVLPPNQQGISLSMEYGYDPRYGTQVAMQDENNFIFITALDAFGRNAAQQGPLPDIAGAQGDPNLLTSLVTGSADLKTAFRSAIVVTTGSAQYLNDGTGGNYTQVNALQSFPTDTNRDFGWKQRYTDGLNRERQSIQQSGQSAGNIMVLTDYTSTGKVVTQSLPFFSTNPIDPQTPFFIDYTYDVVDRKLSQQQPAGSDGNTQTLTTWYYGSGGMVTQTEASGTDEAYVQVTKHHFYDSKDQVQQSIITGDNNATTTFVYDSIARALSITDPPTGSNPEGVCNAITYDSLDRKQTFNNPDQNTTGDSSIKAMTYTYYATTGFLQDQTNAAGQTTTYAYDDLGRVLRTSFADGRTMSYTYDNAAGNGNGRLVRVKVQAADGTMESQQDFAYDNYGNTNTATLTIEGEDSAFVTTSVFDPQKRVVQLTLPDNSVTLRTYDSGQLVSQTMGDTRVDYPLEQYSALGKFGEMVYGKGTLPGEGVVTGYQYNPMGLLYGETVNNQAGTVLQLSYSYDALNQVLGIVDDLDGGQSQSFAYFSKRLIMANIPGFDTGRYMYDASGNIMNKDGAVYTYNAHFPLTMVSGDQTTYSATRDACGNTLTRTTGDQSLAFAYNGSGDLVSIRSGEVILVAALSDYTGRRIREIRPDGTVTLYINAAYQVQRKDGTETITRYLLDSQGAAASVKSGAPDAGALYFRRDHKGNITLTFGADGTVASEITYDGYGLPKMISGPDDFTPKYEQRQWGSDTGLYYFGARYYDPVTARFLTPDSSPGGSSYLEADVMNRFAFELNNPVNRIDPTGHMASWVAGLLIGVTILVVGVAIVATAGAAAAALAPALVAGAATLGATLTTAAATTAASTLITIAGSAAIAAGMSATAYSATHSSNFSWKDYWIQTGISAAVGAATGGLLIGLSAGAAAISSTFWSATTNIVGSGLIASGGDVTGQFFTNLAEGARGHDLANGLLVSAVVGFGFGAGGAMVGYGVNSAGKYLAGKYTDWNFGEQIANDAQIQNTTENLSLLNSPPNPTRLTSFALYSLDIAANMTEQKVGDILSQPLVRMAQLTVTSGTEFPEFYLENREG